MTSVTQNWTTGTRLSVGWAKIMKNQKAALIYNYIAWNTSYKRWYENLRFLETLPLGAKVLDVPCGGGPVLHALKAERWLDYTAADISPVMLQRAEAEAKARGLHYVTTVKEDVTALSFDDETFDVVLDYMGLHCIPRPDVAIAEMVRVLKPGGTLAGNTVTTGGSVRGDVFIKLWQKRGIFAQVHPPDQYREWFIASGLENVQLQSDGAVTYFAATKGS
jgi:ubiquinone/menaquinone biosynthesis C-methylase UbiE